MAARAVIGMCLLAVAATSTQTLVILSTMLKELRIPYYRLTGTANLLMAVSLLFALCAARLFWPTNNSNNDSNNNSNNNNSNNDSDDNNNNNSNDNSNDDNNNNKPWLKMGELKWIWARGFFGAAAAVLSFAAVGAGAPLGDASALGTINIIVASLLGCTLLGERLQALHLVAMLASSLGAWLVIHPEHLFGRKEAVEELGVPWLGYSLALASGVSSGVLFAVSRRIQGASTLVVTCSVTFQEGLALWALSQTGVVKEPTVGALAEQPLRSLLVFLGVLVLISVSAASMSLGPCMCPAAASSTIYMSVSILLGYGAQSVIHRQVPGFITVIGAALMLLGVVLVACTQVSCRSFCKADELCSPT
ncbi:unnamed protein product, partial [Polarella glacialis]